MIFALTLCCQALLIPPNTPFASAADAGVIIVCFDQVNIERTCIQLVVVLVKDEKQPPVQVEKLLVKVENATGR